MTQALIALFSDAPPALHAAAGQFVAAGAEALTLGASAPETGSTAQRSQPLDDDTADWIAVLARSRRIDRSLLAETEVALRQLLPYAAELESRASDRPLILLGRAAAVGALALTGSYVAVHEGTRPDPVDLIGYRHADLLLSVGDPQISDDLTAVGVVPIGRAPDSESGTMPALVADRTDDNSLLVLAPEPLNPDVSFAILEALALLNADGSQPVTLVAPRPLPDPDFVDWANGLDVGDRLLILENHDSDEASLAAIARQADAILATGNSAENVVRAAVEAEAAAIGVASVFDHPVAVALAPETEIHSGATPPELAAAITAAASHRTSPASGTPDARPSLSYAASSTVIGHAGRLHKTPGPAFRAVRQKQWELVYEGESADGYDTKYHDAACYVDLDRTLAGLVADALPATERTRRILDLGCGPGSMVPFLQEIENVEIIGVDVSPAMLRHARERYPDVVFELGNTDALLFDDGSFDVVLVSGVLHHLPVLRTTLDEIRRVLVDGGTFIAREPNEDNLAHRHPVLSFAHQGLRSLVLDHFGHRPQFEPEAHDDHIDFTPRVLSDAIATVFAVEQVATAGVVSYFHDTLDREQQALVSDLEATARAQPGLNLFVSARKADTAGITPDAASWLADFAQTLPIAGDHVDAVLQTFETMLSLNPPTRRTIDDQLASVLASMSSDALILSDGSLSDRPGDDLSREPHGIAISPLAPGEATADLVSLTLSGATSAETLETAASRLRDHGWLVVDLAPDARPDLGPETAALTAVGVEPTVDGHRVLARRHPLGAHDVVVALENLLAEADELIESVGADRIGAWRHRVDAWRVASNFGWPTSSFVRLAPLSETIAALIPPDPG